MTQRWLRFVPASLVTLAWVLTMLAPPSVKPLAGELAAVVLGCLAAATALFGGAPMPRTLRGAAIAYGIGLIALGIGVVAHPGALQSALGAVGQHNGWFLWASLPLWVFAAASAGGGKPARMTLWSLAMLGGVVAVFALLDAAHVYEPAARYSPEVAGLLESSVSLGQVLLLTLGATTAALFVEENVGVRVGAGALVALEVAALAVSGARGAQMAFFVGLVLFGLWWLSPRMSRMARRWLAVAGVAVLVVGAVFIAYAAAGGPTAPGMATADRLLTQRVTIWHSAAAHVPKDLIVGAGSDRFSAVVTWNVVPGGSLTYNMTTSPHDVVLDWLVSGGLIAALAMLTAFALAGWRVTTSPRAAFVGTKAIGVALAAWALSLLLSWVDPLSLIVAGVLLGGLFASPRSAGAEHTASDSHRYGEYAAAAALVIVAVAVAVVGARLFALERAWARESAQGAQPSAATAVARWNEWHDPAFAVSALAAAQASGDTTAASGVAAQAMQSIPWSAQTALACAEMAAGMGSNAPAGMPSLAACLAAGRVADPASGMWDRIQQLVTGR